MSASLLELFDQYCKTNTDESWRNGYKALYSQIEEIRTGRQSLAPHFVKQIWTQSSFGPANIGQGVITSEQFDKIEPILKDVTELIINEPTAAALDKAYKRFTDEKANGVMKWIPWAATRRLMAASSPQRYSSVITSYFQLKLKNRLKQQYNLNIPAELNRPGF